MPGKMGDGKQPVTTGGLVRHLRRKPPQKPGVGEIHLFPVTLGLEKHSLIL